MNSSRNIAACPGGFFRQTLCRAAALCENGATQEQIRKIEKLKRTSIQESSIQPINEPINQDLFQHDSVSFGPSPYTLPVRPQFAVSQPHSSEHRVAQPIRSETAKISRTSHGCTQRLTCRISSHG